MKEVEDPPVTAVVAVLVTITVLLFVAASIKPPLSANVPLTIRSFVTKLTLGAFVELTVTLFKAIAELHWKVVLAGVDALPN